MSRLNQLFKGGLCAVLLWLSNQGIAQPVYEAFETAVGVAAGATINKPTGTVQNDLLVVGIMYEKGSSETITPPAGWTLVVRNDNSTDAGQSVYYKIAGAAEPVSYTFNIDDGSKWAIGCSRISNVDPSVPIGTVNTAVGNGTAVLAPSMTVPVSNAMILCFYTNKKNSTYTPDGSTSERYDAPNSVEGAPSNMIATFVQAGVGATGNRTATASDTEEWSSVQIAVRRAGALPIELADFTARAEKNEVVLNWTTATETNNHYFTLERSMDGRSFHEIERVEGAGNSTETLFYTFIDKQPLQGTSYYRLKQTDFDGAFTYSKTVAVEVLTDLEVSLYPNPAVNGQFQLQFSTEQEQKLSLEIYNHSGALVYAKQQRLTSGVSVLNLNLKQQLPPGIYLIRGIGELAKFERNLVIQ